MEQEVSRYLLQLRRHHPFLATISMFADYQFTDKVERFDTDGRRIRINPDYYNRLPKEERIGILMHTTLHSALLHPIRRGMRDELVWNIAADIVVNNIIIESGVFRPPLETAVEPRYATLSVEQVYERLKSIKPQRGSMSLPGTSVQQVKEKQQSQAKSQTAVQQVQEKQQSQAKSQTAAQKIAGIKKQSSPASEYNQAQNAMLMQLYPVTPDLHKPEKQQTSAQKKSDHEIQNYWRGALRRAQIIERLEHHKQQGDMPLGLIREIETMYLPQLDWRTLLWRFMIRTPCDFVGFDRRFLHQKLYLDQLEGEALKVYLAIDSSGSISEEELAQFMTEVNAILNSYTHLKAILYYIDAGVYGPYEVHGQIDVPPPRGGGGTDFIVFFNQLNKQHDDLEGGLCIYLTDGYSDFPCTPPKLPVLWVVSHGGVESENFPFGEVARLSAE